MKVYVASSWRNTRQPSVVEALRSAGHEVYDFRHPAPGNEGFHWSEIDPEWRDWNADRFIEGLMHPIAVRGFDLDMDALSTCGACVLVLPCGRSAHLEAGFAAGAHRDVYVLLEPDGALEPELMYRMTDWIGSDVDELVREMSRREAAVREIRQRALGASCP